MLKGLVDTNIITAIFKGHPQCINKYEQYLDEYGTVHLSVVVYYEIYRGLLELGNKRKLRLFDEFIQQCSIYAIDRRVIIEAAKWYVRLKRTGKLIQDADILIASTAIVHGLGVITDNVRHFKRSHYLNVRIGKKGGMWRRCWFPGS